MSLVRIRRQIGQAVLLLSVIFAAGAFAYHLARPRIEIQLRTPEGKPLADVDVVIEHFAKTPGSRARNGMASFAKVSGRTDERGVVKIVRNRRTEYLKITDAAGVMLFKRGSRRWRASGVVPAPKAPEKSVTVEALQELSHAEILLVGAVPIKPGQKRVIRVIEHHDQIREIRTTGDSFGLIAPPGYHYDIRVGRTHPEMPDVIEWDRVVGIPFPSAPGPTTIPLTFDSRTPFNGVIEMPDGTPAQGLRVRVSSNSNMTRSTQFPNTSYSSLTGPDGVWSVWVPSGDSYAFKVIPGSGREDWLYRPTNAPEGVAFSSRGGYRHFSSRKLEFTKPIVIALEPAATLHGRVLSESGTPVRGATLIVHFHPGNTDVVSPPTDVNGASYAYLLPSGLPSQDAFIAAQTDDAVGAAQVQVTPPDPEPFEIRLRRRVDVLVPKSDPADQVSIRLLPEFGSLPENTVWERDYWRFGFRVKDMPSEKAFKVSGIPAGITGITVTRQFENGFSMNRRSYIVDAEGRLVGK